MVKKTTPSTYNLATKKDESQTEHYSYFPNNQLKEIVRVDESRLTFAYDINENVTQVVATSKEGKSETLNYSYDALSNLEEATTSQHHLEILYTKRANPAVQIQNGIDVHRGYDFDDEDRVKTLSFLNESVHHHYDEFHKLERLNYDLKDIEFGYDKNQTLTQRTYPNRQSEELEFDKLYNLLTIGDKKTKIEYKYNENQEVVSKLDPTVSDELITYDYNPRGELTQAGETEYSYNSAGNQIQEKQRYNHLNHLLENRSYLYTYDERGNLKTKTHKETKTKTTYTFNLFNQLTQVTTTDQEQN